MKRWQRTLGPVMGMLLVSACGGGGGSADGGGGGGGGGGGTPGPTVTLSAAATTVDAGTSTTLTWSSTNATSCSASGGWSGTKATSGSEGTGNLSQDTGFGLTCTGAGGSASKEVTITVNLVVGNKAGVRGQVIFEHIKHSDTLGAGLNFAGGFPLRPARGIVVEALAAGGSTVLASSTTNETGDYVLAVDPNVSVQVRARAESRRAAPLLPPFWNVKVTDGSDTAYTYTSPTSVTSGAAGTTTATLNVSIPTGWSAGGSVVGTRASAPFTILDAIYQSIGLVASDVSGLTFPALKVDWKPSNAAGTTGYANNGSPTLRVAGQAGVDADEYDWGKIIHHYAHYLEDSFGRADAFRGPHSVTDDLQLDPRAAYSEGLANAFAAMVLDVPVIRDSYGPTQNQDLYMQVATARSADPGWYSPVSIQRLAYDAHATMGASFGQIWDVITGPVRTTPAFTTIYPFVVGLKAEVPSAASQIDTRLAAERITSSGLDAWGSAEANFPAGSAREDSLPIYTQATIGGSAVTVRSTNRWISDNAGGALSNSRFVRFNVASARSVTITAQASGRNVDFGLYKAGDLVASGTTAGTGAETLARSLDAGDYVLDVYDCVNAGTCGGTPQSVDISVTLQ